MDWSQVLTIIAANFGLFLWIRTESRNDARHTETWVKASIEAIREEGRNFQKAIQDEMKDFHGRLCAIEERYRSK